MCVIVADIKVDVDSSHKGLHQTSKDDNDQAAQNNWLMSMSSVEEKTHCSRLKRNRGSRGKELCLLKELVMFFINHVEIKGSKNEGTVEIMGRIKIYATSVKV